MKRVMGAARTSGLARSQVFKSLGSLEPGGTTLIPSCVGLSPLMFVVQRYLSPEQKKCTFTASSSR